MRFVFKSTMYRNRKLMNNGISNSIKNKRNLNTIDENATIKIPRLTNETRNLTKDVTDIDESLSSEENIPASQEPTQRYLSQRSTLASTLGRTNSRTNNSQRPPNTYFELALMKAGVQLDEAENFVLACDHISFVNKLRILLYKAENFEDNVNMFITGLHDAWSKYALKLLSGCTISIPSDDSVYQSQNSMILNFFMIECLRDKILEFLLGEIKKVAIEKNSSLKSPEMNKSLLPLMLSQLQYVASTHSQVVYEHIKINFEYASEHSKWDIINSAGLILDCSKHDDFAKLLIDNLAHNKDLFKSSTIKTLTNLSLSTKIQGILRDKIFVCIKEDQCSTETVPLFIKFLLKTVSKDSEETMKRLVNTLREILHWSDGTLGSSLAKDKHLQLELFGYIEQGLTRSKKFYNLWQKLIASLSSPKFKPIDFVIILLLIKIRDDNSLYLQNILRRHIKQLSTSIVQEIRNKYAPILEQHWDILMQIINVYLRDKHKTVVNFARTCCSKFFEISENVQKSILKKLLKLTCEKSLKNTTNFALHMLRDLWHLYPKVISNWGMLLLPFLDHIHEMTLSHTRIVMELLSSIAYPAPTIDECTILQDQIDMLIKKQIINTNIFVKKQGIIGAVQFIDCIARIEQHAIEADDFDTTINSISAIPDGRGKIAATYVERVQSSILHSPELLALFYDELASVCSAGGGDRANGLRLDIPFVLWLSELITIYFQNSFVVELSPGNVAGIQLTYMMCRNSIADTNTEGDTESELPQIAINIGELVLRPRNEASSSIIILAPIFNLVRVLHMLRYEGSLELINALLGCAIILPTFFHDNVEAIFFDYDKEMQKKILDIYFHCVNWLREIVSSFPTQREPMIRKKVLERLTDLINIEHKIRELLLRAPSDYNPPQCDFITSRNPLTIACKSGNKIHASRNRNMNNNNNSTKNKIIQNQTKVSHLNDTNLNDNTRTNDLTSKLAGASKAKSYKANYFENIYGRKELYRQMNTNIVLLLKETLEVNYPLAADQVGHCMGLLEFRFILTDIVSKLESVVGIQKFQSEQSVQYIAKPGHLMCDLSDFICSIGRNMRKISAAIHLKLDEVQNIYSHADLFTDEFNLLKACFGLCLRLLVAFFSWSEWFVNELFVNKLKESLFVLLETAQYQDYKNKPIPVLAIEVFNMLIKYEGSVVELKSAVYLYQMLEIINLLSDKNTKTNRCKDIRSLCRTLLCRKWFNYDGVLEKGAQCNTYLDELLKGFFQDSDFKRQREILRIVKDESKGLHDKDNSLKSFPNFKRTNFPLLFRGLCETLVTSLNQKLTTHALEKIDKLQFWESSGNILNMLLEVVQGLNLPRNFHIFLKYSHLYLKLVLLHGLNVFEQYLRQSPERVCELIRTMQTTTRFLHHLCCHSKAIKNTAIISQIPCLRETVETYVFRIKALLTANQCGSVFSMGNLKNKDLHGDDLVSQISTLSTITAQDSDEEIPDDDISIDETILGNDDTESAGNCVDNRSKSFSRSKCI